VQPEWIGKQLMLVDFHNAYQMGTIAWLENISSNHIDYFLSALIITI